MNDPRPLQVPSRGAVPGDDPLRGDIPFHDSLEALSVGIAIYDAEGLLAYANPALWAQMGPDTVPLPRGTPRPRMVAAMEAAGHFGEKDPAAWERFAHVFDLGRPYRALFRNLAGRWHEMIYAPLPDGGGVGLSVEVTDVRRTEGEASEHAALFGTILARLDTGILVSDGAGRLTYFNDAYRRLSGARPGAIRLGITRQDLFEHLLESGSLAGMDPARLAHLPRAGAQGTETFRRRRPDGTILSVRASPIAEGGVLTEMHDITALSQAEQTAQERAALLDGVLEALPHGVCVYGPDRRVQVVNAAYQHIMVGAEVAVGEHHDDIIDRRLTAGEYDDVPETRGRLKRDFLAGTNYERTRTRPNGTVVSVRIVALPAGGMVVVMTDVTARTAAEAEAARRAATLQAMLDNQPDGVALFDVDEVLIAANALAARLTGLGDSMQPGQHMLALRAAQIASTELGDAEAAKRFIAERGHHRLHEGDRYLRARPDGTMLEVRTDRTPDGGYIRTYRDVTEERRIRAELEAARDAAEAASRAKSGFLDTMTHELRTPLHAVIGFSEAILQESRPEAIRDHAEEVLAAGRQLLGLVEGLLEATRIEADSLVLRGAVFDPAPLLRAAATRIRKAAQASGLELLAEDLPAGLPPLRADEARLRQVLDALLSNAVKFTPEGGRIALSARVTEGGTVVEIADSGIGMDPADIPRAFEAFTQLEAGLTRRYPGSGLGLYLARALTGAMGIALTLDSTPGGGTTVRLVLPPAEEIPA